MNVLVAGEVPCLEDVKGGDDPLNIDIVRKSYPSWTFRKGPRYRGESSP